MAAISRYIGTITVLSGQEQDFNSDASRDCLRSPLICLLVFSVVTLLWSASAASTESTIAGSWAINVDLTDDNEDSIDGKMRKSRFLEDAPDRGTGAFGRETIHDVSQREYWDTVQAGRERRSMKDLRRLGSAYPLLTAESLAIADQGGVYLFTYDKLLPRNVRPNPAGRSYSANGDELVVDTIGHTLAYWDQAELILETDAPSGGQYIERLKLRAQSKQLEYSVELRVNALKEAVVIKRVYDRR